MLRFPGCRERGEVRPAHWAGLGWAGLGWLGWAVLGWRWRWQGFYLECFHCAAQWADTQIVSQQTRLHHLHTPPGLKIETLPPVHQVPRDEDSYFLPDWNYLDKFLEVIIVI